MELVMALAAMALLTRVGFALYNAGLVRAKNAGSSVVRVLADVGFAVLAFWLMGAMIVFQHQNPWIGFNFEMAFWRDSAMISLRQIVCFITLVMMLTATPAVVGAMGERARFWPLCIASAVLAGFVLPVTTNWAWSGWLVRRGYFDVAGGGSLHVACGAFAAVGAMFLGPRTGKFNRDGSSSMIPGHNVTLTSVGAIIVMTGWVGYIAGGGAYHFSQGSMSMEPNEIKGYVLYAAASAWNILLGASAATVSSIVYTQIRYDKPDIILIITAMLGGLVSIAAGAMILPSWAAVLIGLVAGILVPWAVVALDLRGRVDDPSGAIAIHGIGGAWGTIAVAFFMRQPLTNSRFQQVGIQIVGVVVIALFAALIGAIVFAPFHACRALRTRESDEFDGLDLAEHDIGAYPDFQQTTIKSYHLREA